MRSPDPRKPVPPESDLLVPAVEGLLSAADVRATGESIAELQLPSGQVPWYPGGHCEFRQDCQDLGRVR